MGSIFGVFGASKKEAKFERILGSIFEDSQGWAVGPAMPVRIENPVGNGGMVW